MQNNRVEKAWHPRMLRFFAKANVCCREKLGIIPVEQQRPLFGSCRYRAN